MRQLWLFRWRLYSLFGGKLTFGEYVRLHYWGVSGEGE